MDNSFLLDAMDWSYSRVSSFDQCPRMFDLTYLQCMDRVDNAFAQWGSLAHSLLERYFRQQVELWDLSGLYEKEYARAVTERFPFPRLEGSYYERGMEYFDNFGGQLGDEEKVLAVEDRYTSTLGGRPVVGIIDLVLRNRSGLIVCDHKSRGKWKSREERRKYLRQLNLYAVRVKEVYGEWPHELWFNKFREGILDRDPFNIVTAQEDIDWFLRSIDDIYKARSFPAKPDRFINMTGAKVVLSSDWRYDRDDPRYNGDYLELEAELLKYGIRLYGFTPELPSCHRGMEIDCWLKEHSEVGDFVILDDRTDIEPNKDHWVQTVMRRGLGVEEAESAIRILNGK